MSTYCKDKSCKHNTCHNADWVRCGNNKSECTYEKVGDTNMKYKVIIHNLSKSQAEIIQNGVESKQKYPIEIQEE